MKFRCPRRNKWPFGVGMWIWKSSQAQIVARQEGIQVIWAMAGKGIWRYDMQGQCPTVKTRQDKAGACKSTEGNVLVDMVDM